MATLKIINNKNTWTAHPPKEHTLHCGKTGADKNTDRSVTPTENAEFPKKYKNVLAFLIDNPSRVELKDSTKFFTRRDEYFETFYE